MTSVQIYSEHLKDVGIDKKELDEIIEYLTTRFKGQPVYDIYLTPGASWSDHCVHEYLHKSNQHMEGSAPKCQVNGVAYRVGPGMKCRDLFKSADLGGVLSFYDVKVKTGITDPTKLGQIGANMKKEFLDKIDEIKGEIGKYFVSKSKKTALSIFSGYETEDENLIRANLMQLRGGGLKIGSMNGSVHIGFYSKAENNEVTYTVKLSIRSYDEMSTMALLERIYKENPTIEQFAGNDYTKSREECRRNTMIQQGHLAYTILNEILGWSTDKEPTSSPMSYTDGNLVYLPASAMFYYNWIWGNKDGSFSYYDHCYKLSQCIDNGYWPLLIGRDKGLSILECGNMSELFASTSSWIVGTVALPMGPRKLIHRSAHNVKSSYRGTEASKIISELELEALGKVTGAEGVYTWHGQGERHYKLFEGKYSTTEPNKILQMAYKYNGQCQFNDVTTWTSDFVQEFGPNISGTMGVTDKLFLFDEPVVVIEMGSDFYAQHFSKLLLWGAKKGITMGDIVCGQDMKSLMITLNRDVMKQYLAEV